MKIPIDRELKIVLLTSLKRGYLDTNEMPLRLDSIEGSVFYKLLENTGTIANDDVDPRGITNNI